MAQDTHSLIPLNEVSKHLPTRRGRPVHAHTVYRWITKGARGRRLQAVLLGGRLYVSPVHLAEFIRPLLLREPTVHRQEVQGSANAARILDEAGIGGEQ